ncbi:MAG: hypothetical protein IH934_00930 [Nanoarchaeota archaeon]|nr:hypothetical protein [Nanoarchaeota archaeon]
MNTRMRILLLIVVIILFSFAAYSHEEEIKEERKDIGESLSFSSKNYVMIAAVIAGILVLLSIYNKEKDESKMFLFLGIVIPIILATAYLAGSTIYLNLISETKGPVHWHADFEIWNCGKKVDLIDPKGLSNRIGTPVFHEHGDDRIHVEGVVVKKKDVDLHTFFEVVGGSLTNNYLAIPTNDKVVEKGNGDLCNGKQGKLQVFLYKIQNPEDTKNWIFEQEKLEDFEDYVLSSYSQIPPGDCIIIEFDVQKETTEHICESYKVAFERGDLSGS